VAGAPVLGDRVGFRPERPEVASRPEPGSGGACGATMATAERASPCHGVVPKRSPPVSSGRFRRAPPVDQ
jgi:hypothetical protein